MLLESSLCLHVTLSVSLGSLLGGCVQSCFRRDDSDPHPPAAAKLNFGFFWKFCLSLLYGVRFGLTGNLRFAKFNRGWVEVQVSPGRSMTRFLYMYPVTLLCVDE